jgi:hypothetical protein
MGIKTTVDTKSSSKASMARPGSRHLRIEPFRPRGSVRRFDASGPTSPASEPRKELVPQAEEASTAHAAPVEAEARSELLGRRAIVLGLGVAAVAGLVTVNILVLAILLPAWATGLCMSGVALTVALLVGALSFGKRVQLSLAAFGEAFDEAFDEGL